MFSLPVNFPSEVDRLRRLIHADRNLDFLQRIQSIDGILNTIDMLTANTTPLPARDRLRQLREEQGHKCFREFIQRQLANQSADA